METVRAVLENVGLLAMAAVLASVVARRIGVPPDTLARRIVIGVVLGLTSALVVLAPITGPLGSSFDARAAPVAMAGFFGGPIGGAVAAALGALARLEVGGPQAVAGMISFPAYALVGVVAGRVAGGRAPGLAGLACIGLAVCATAVVVFYATMPAERAAAILSSHGPVLLSASFGGVIVLGLILRELFALEAAHDRLEDDARRLAEQLGDAHAASEAKSRFVATMSHELRTPLNAIIGLADVIRRVTPERLGAEKTDANLAMIHGSGRHLLSLVEDALDLARIERGGRPLELAPTAVDEAVEEAAEMAAQAAAARRVTIRRATSGLTAQADRRALVQCLLNLLSNAARHAPEGSEVDVAAAARDGVIEICVRDRGAGMPQTVAARLGEAFLRDPARPTKGGVGLGLAITKGLAEAQGGRLRYRAGDGGGAILVLALPAALPAAQSNAAAA